MASRPQSPISPVVLVVDDEPIILSTMARTLLEAGYAVHMASSGLDALALGEELPRPPDLVVTDLRMEPMGGAELAERLFSRGLASRFLFVSGYGSAAEYNEDFGPLLAKPFSPDRLVQSVLHLLSDPVTARTELFVPER
jgi:two-component system cell cycle sensor histidine kinase/response regulator CckA